MINLLVITEKDYTYTVDVMKRSPLKKRIHHLERLQILYMWLAGMRCNAISLTTGRSRSSVCRWVNRWKNEGHINSRPRNRRSSIGKCHERKQENITAVYDTEMLTPFWIHLTSYYSKSFNSYFPADLSLIYGSWK